MRDNYIIIAGHRIIGGRLSGEFVRGFGCDPRVAVILADAMRRFIKRRKAGAA